MRGRGRFKVKGSSNKKNDPFSESGANITLVLNYQVQVVVSRSNAVGGVGSKSMGCQIRKMIHFSESEAKVILEN